MSGTFISHFEEFRKQNEKRAEEWRQAAHEDLMNRTANASGGGGSTGGGTPVGYVAGPQDIQGQADLLGPDSELIQNMKTQTDEVYADIQGAMEQLTALGEEATVDTQGLVGRMEEGFTQTKNLIVRHLVISSRRKTSQKGNACLETFGRVHKSQTRKCGC